MVNVDVDGDFSFDLCFESGMSPLIHGRTRKVLPSAKNIYKTTRSGTSPTRPYDWSATHQCRQVVPASRKDEIGVGAHKAKYCTANEAMQDNVQPKLRQTVEVAHQSHHRLLFVSRDCCKDQGITVTCAEEDCEFSFDMCFECAAFEVADTNTSDSSTKKVVRSKDSILLDQT
jgi:hypothetical protein